MKITYNFNQKFELVEICLWNNTLVFKTNNGMGKFDEEDYFKKDENGNVFFKVYFEHISELQNIPKLLWDYLDEKSLMYWCD